MKGVSDLDEKGSRLNTGTKSVLWLQDMAAT